MIEMEQVEIAKKSRAIVMFGPMTTTAGMRPGEFFQVTINPDMVSPQGDYIRFDARSDDEIHGWQRVESLTVCEILEELPDEVKDKPVVMRKVV